MTAARLLRFYPRAWRDRYGDEFLALIGDQPLAFRQVVDIVSAAIDARLSRDVRRVARPTTPNGEGDVMIETLKRSCVENAGAAFTNRDTWMAVGLIIGGSIALSAMGGAFSMSRHRGVGGFLGNLAFPGAVLLSTHFTYMRKQPWKAQIVILGGTGALVGLATYLAHLL